MALATVKVKSRDKDQEVKRSSGSSRGQTVDSMIAAYQTTVVLAVVKGSSSQFWHVKRSSAEMEGQNFWLTTTAMTTAYTVWEWLHTPWGKHYSERLLHNSMMEAWYPQLFGGAQLFWPAVAAVTIESMGVTPPCQALHWCEEESLGTTTNCTTDTDASSQNLDSWHPFKTIHLQKQLPYSQCYIENTCCKACKTKLLSNFMRTVNTSTTHTDDPTT